MRIDAAPYKRAVHQFLAGLVIDLAEVDPAGRASELLGVDGHERTHELARVHGSQEVPVHVFLQLLSPCLGEWSWPGAVLVITPGCRLGRGRMVWLGGHDESRVCDNERAPFAHRYMSGLSDPQMTRADAGRRIQQADSPSRDQHKIDYRLGSLRDDNTEGERWPRRDCEGWLNS